MGFCGDSIGLLDKLRVQLLMTLAAFKLTECHIGGQLHLSVFESLTNTGWDLGFLLLLVFVLTLLS